MDISVLQQTGANSNTQSNVDRLAQTEMPVSKAQNLAAATIEKDFSRDDVEKAVSQIQEYVQTARRNVNFSLEDELGRVIVKVTDAESGKTIRQMPSEEALRLAERLDEVRSLLFSAQV